MVLRKSTDRSKSAVIWVRNEVEGAETLCWGTSGVRGFDFSLNWVLTLLWLSAIKNNRVVNHSPVLEGYSPTTQFELSTRQQSETKRFLAAKFVNKFPSRTPIAFSEENWGEVSSVDTRGKYEKLAMACFSRRVHQPCSQTVMKHFLIFYVIKNNKKSISDGKFSERTEPKLTSENCCVAVVVVVVAENLFTNGAAMNAECNE